jgi:hypothetical protein
MIVYSEHLRPNGPLVTVKVRWAIRPYILAQGDELPALRLVGLRLVGERLEVGIGTPQGVDWAPLAGILDEHEADRWARRGFGQR